MSGEAYRMALASSSSCRMARRQRALPRISYHPPAAQALSPSYKRQWTSLRTSDVVAVNDAIEASLERKGMYGISEAEMLRGFFEVAMSQRAPAPAAAAARDATTYALSSLAGRHGHGRGRNGRDHRGR